MTKDSSDGYGTVERQVFRIYDMPPAVSFRLIEFAKKHSGNKAWVAIEQLLDYAQLVKRLASIEERLTAIEEKENGKV